MVREFNLINDKGQKYSLMDIENSALMTEPTGLGYTYADEYEQLGNTFISNLRKIEQGQIEGTLNFLKYDNYRNIVNFIEKSSGLRFEYKVPYEDGEKTYYKDIQLQSITKTEKATNGIISEGVIFDNLSLWYMENTAIYEMSGGDGEMRWDFSWDPRFSNYSVRSLTFVNEGHVEAPIEVTIDGNVQNPKIQLYIEGILYQEVPFTITLTQYEKLLYGTKENNFYLLKQEGDGTTSNIFNLSVVTFNNDNIIRLPQDKSCELRLVADNDIASAQVKIFTYYKAI